MKKFAIKIALYIFLVLGTVLGVIYLPPINSEKYIWALVDKHHLLSTVPQPRIVFVGDSSLAFGLNSRLVKNATGYNIVNMGLHGGLGMIYYMNEVKPYLKRGDIVILIPDYMNYGGPGIGDNTLIEVTIVLPRMFCYLSRYNIWPFITNIPFTFQRRLGGLLNPSRGENRTHRRSNFNEFGDNEGHIGLPRQALKDVAYLKRMMPELSSVQLQRPVPDRIHNDLVDRINEFRDYCESRGVAVYIAFPPLMEGDRKLQEKVLRSFEKDMKKRVRIQTIGDPISNIYPEEYFFDNEFHLNGTGRDVRTRNLIDSMKAVPRLAAAPK